MQFSKYKKNLSSDGKYIYSYGTEVAEINNATKKIHSLGWWSATTSKHVNHAAEELGFEIIPMQLDGKAV